MANPFDQFDAPATSNPFDAFDDPSFKPPKPSGMLRRGIGDTAVSLGKGVIGLGEGAVGLSSLATGGLAGQLAEQAGFRPKEAKAMLDEFYSPEQQAANRAVSDAKGFGGTLSSILQNPSVVPQMVAESLPSMIGGQAIAKGALKAAGLAGEAITPTAARWAGAGGEGAITAGGVAEQIRQEAPDGNIYAAVPAGVATGLIGVAGGKLANRLGLGDIDTALLTTANRGTASLPKRVIGGAISEGLLEEAPQSAQEQAFTNLGTGKPLMEGVPEAAALGGVLGGAMGGGFGVLSKPAGPLSRAAETATETGAAQEQQRIAAEQASADRTESGQAPGVAGAQSASQNPAASATQPLPVDSSSIATPNQDQAPNLAANPAGTDSPLRTNVPANPSQPPSGSFGNLADFEELLNAERGDIAERRNALSLAQDQAARREQMARAQERARPMPTTNVQSAQKKAAQLTHDTGVPHTVVPTGKEIGGKPLVIVQEQSNGAIPATTPAEVAAQGGEAQGLEPARSAGDVERNAAVGGNDGADAGAAALGVRPDTAVRDVAGGERVDAPLYPTPKRSDSPSWVIRNKETGEVQFETFDRKKVDALNTAKYEAVPILHYLQEINRKVANAPQAQGARHAGVEVGRALSGNDGVAEEGQTATSVGAVAQGANVQDAPNVSEKTPDQLAYLSTNGKPGWKEAAQAEIQRRSLSSKGSPIVNQVVKDSSTTQTGQISGQETAKTSASAGVSADISADKTAEQKIRDAWKAKTGTTIGSWHPLTVEHNGVSQNFMANQKRVSNGRKDAAIHLVSIRNGRLMASDPARPLAYYYKLDGNNNLAEEGIPSIPTELQLKKWRSSGFAVPGEQDTQTPADAARPPAEMVKQGQEAPAAQSQPAPISPERLQETKQLLEDNISTKKSNGEKVPQAWINKLAEVNALIRGEQTSAGEIYSIEVEGHPMVDGSPMLRNLIPIKVRTAAEAERKLFSAQDLYSKIAGERAKAEHAMRLAKTAAQKRTATDALKKLDNNGATADALNTLRTVTLPELQRLVKEAEQKFGSSEKPDTAPPEPTPGQAPAGEKDAAEEIFIRKATKRERTGGKPNQDAMRALPEKDGYEVVFKPYGNDGEGFYYKKRNADRKASGESLKGAAQGVVRDQPTHSDPGQSPKTATAPVISKSLQKSSRNTPLNIKEAKAWLLSDIDRAIANVPPENNDMAVELAQDKTRKFKLSDRVAKLGKGVMRDKLEKSEREQFDATQSDRIAKIARQIGFVTFDVPGDGKFRVVNTVDAIAAFRAKVEASPGFREQRSRSVPAQRSTASQGELSRMAKEPLDDKSATLEDLANAIEIARANGIDDIQGVLDRFEEVASMDYDTWRGEQDANDLRQGEPSPSAAPQSPEQSKAADLSQAEQPKPAPAKASEPAVEVSNAGGAKSDDISKPETTKNDVGSGAANADRAANTQQTQIKQRQSELLAKMNGGNASNAEIDEYIGLVDAEFSAKRAGGKAEAGKWFDTPDRAKSYLDQLGYTNNGRKYEKSGELRISIQDAGVGRGGVTLEADQYAPDIEDALNSAAEFSGRAEKEVRRIYRDLLEQRGKEYADEMLHKTVAKYYPQSKASPGVAKENSHQGKENAVSLTNGAANVKESAKTDTRSAENEQKAPDSVSTGEQKGGAKFSRNTTATTIDSAALKQTVAFLRKAYPQATIREHESDQSPTVPKALRDDIANSGAQDDVAGAYKDGVVHVFRSGIRDQSHAEKTIVHELTHRGLARMFGLGIKQPMLGIYASNADIATEADRIAKQYGYDLATAVEEALADLGGDMVSVKGFDKLVAYVRAALRKLGLVSEWSNNDVALLVQRAREKNKGGFTESAKFAPAWHGSPHDFDRFSTENIGTGEGAQAYGHGLYFAGAKEVAEYYRDNVRNMARVDEINKELSSIAKEMAKYQTGYRQYLDPKGYELANQYDALMDEKAGIRDAKGRLYQVELAPKEDEYLLWGKPLSEQSEKVRISIAGMGHVLEEKQKRMEARKHIYTSPVEKIVAGWTGSDLYDMTVDYFTNEDEAWSHIGKTPNDVMNVQQAASDYLHSLGIRGIKYLDGSSRSHGDGNYNYVIFNDADVSITAKYSRSAQAFARATDSAAFQKSGEILSDLFTTHGTFGALKGLKTQYHKATLNPMFKAFWERANAMAMDSARSMSRPADLASRILPKFDPRNMGDAAKALFAGRSDVLPGDLKAVSRALSDGTLDGGPSPLKGKVWTDEELSKRGMNDKQASLYREARAAIDSSLTEVAAATAWSLARRSIENDFLRQRVADAPEEASVILPMAMDYAIAREVEKLREAQDGMAEAYDPEAAAKEMESIQKHLSAMQDDASSIRAIFDKAEALKQAGYMPLMRFGKYRIAVTMRENGKEVATYVGRYESHVEANRARRELERQFSGSEFTVGPVSIENENAWKMFKGVNPETVMLFAEEAGIKADDIMQQWYREAVSSRSALKRMIERTGVAGYSEDLPRVLASFITSNGKQAGYAYHLGDMQEMLQNKDMPGDVQEEAQSLLETIQEPTEAGSKMRGLMAMWYLLGSIGSALVNSTQTVTMSIPWLSQFGAKGFSATEAASAMGKAYKIVVNPITMPADLKAAMKRAEQNGTVDSNEVFHLYAESMKPMISKLGSGNRAYRARAFMTLWGAPFAMVETLNRRATFAAAYSMAKAQGKSEGDAAKFAERAVIETQGIYAKHNRPNWSRGAIGAATLTFKQFSIAYVEMLSRMAKNGPEGKKAALLTLGILMALSGASGLPGEDDLLDVIDTFSQIFFDKPTLSRMEIRNFLHDNLGKELGGFVNSGVSNFLPVDVSSRLGLGNLIPGTGLFKPSEKDKTGELLEIFAGVQGGFVRSMVDSVRMIAEGNVSGAIKSAAPKAIQDVAKGVEMLATGEARDRAGRKVVDASPADSIWQMIGLNPNVKAEAGKKAWDVTEYMGYVKNVESGIVGRWARGIVDSDMEAIGEAKKELAEWNLSNPDAPIGIYRTQIMQRVQALLMERAGRIEKMAPREMRGRVRELMEED